MDHQQHQCIGISEAASEAREDIQSILFSMENISLPRMERLLESVLQGKDKYNEFAQKAFDNSTKKFRYLRMQLDAAERDWTKQFNKRKQADIAEIEMIQAELDDQLTKMHDVINACKTALQETNNSALLSFQTDLSDAGNIGQKEISFPPVIIFFPSDYKLPVTEELLGVVKSGTRQQLCTDGTKEELLRRRHVFTKGMLQKTELFSIDSSAECLGRTDKNEMLTYCDKTITIYNETFLIRYTIDLDFEVNDISYTPFHGIIVTDWAGRKVIEVSRTGEVCTLLNSWPLIPGGLCIDDSEKIVVGLYAGYGVPPIKLVVYSVDNFEVLREIEYNTAGEPLFTKAILQVKQNGNGDFIVSDAYRIVCVSREGLNRWEYLLDLDYVYGIACDEYDNIIIAQRVSNTISLLDSEGSLLSTILTEDDGIIDPIPLAIDHHGNLWIGQEDEVKVVKYIK